MTGNNHDDRPNVVVSSKSQQVEKDGEVYSIDIYKLEGEDEWTLELIDKDSTSLVWNEVFRDDQKAFDEGYKVIMEEGHLAFREDADVIPFPQN